MVSVCLLFLSLLYGLRVDETSSSIKKREKYDTKYEFMTMHLRWLKQIAELRCHLIIIGLYAFFVDFFYILVTMAKKTKKNKKNKKKNLRSQSSSSIIPQQGKQVIWGRRVKNKTII